MDDRIRAQMAELARSVDAAIDEATRIEVDELVADFVSAIRDRDSDRLNRILEKAPMFEMRLRTLAQKAMDRWSEDPQ